jgi:hypothetical protein
LTIKKNCSLHFSKNAPIPFYYTLFFQFTAVRFSALRFYAAGDGDSALKKQPGGLFLAESGAIYDCA